jgi:hypothetical protein
VYTFELKRKLNKFDNKKKATEKVSFEISAKILNPKIHNIF